MKKISKVLALGLATALVFGMSVSAANSPSTSDTPNVTEAPATEAPATEAPATEAPATQPPATQAPSTEAPATQPPATQAPSTEAPATEAPATEVPATQPPVADDNNNPSEGASNVGAATEGGVELVITPLGDASFTVANDFVKAVAGNEAEANKVLAAAGQTGRKVTSVVAVKTFDLAAPQGWDGTSAVTVDFAVSNVNADKTYVVFHYKNGINAAPEVLSATVVNGKIRATFSSFSPVVIAEVNSEVIQTGENNNGGSNDSNNSGTPESPKTGEALPVAGLLAVICMAGAALCAAKARYNK